MHLHDLDIEAGQRLGGLFHQRGQQIDAQAHIAGFDDDGMARSGVDLGFVVGSEPGGAEYVDDAGLRGQRRQFDRIGRRGEVDQGLRVRDRRQGIVGQRHAQTFCRRQHSGVGAEIGMAMTAPARRSTSYPLKSRDGRDERLAHPSAGAGHDCAYLFHEISLAVHRANCSTRILRRRLAEPWHAQESAPRRTPASAWSGRTAIRAPPRCALHRRAGPCMPGRGVGVVVHRLRGRARSGSAACRFPPLDHRYLADERASWLTKTHTHARAGHGSRPSVKPDSNRCRRRTGRPPHSPRTRSAPSAPPTRPHTASLSMRNRSILSAALDASRAVAAVPALVCSTPRAKTMRQRRDGEAEPHQQRCAAGCRSRVSAYTNTMLKVAPATSPIAVSRAQAAHRARRSDSVSDWRRLRAALQHQREGRRRPRARAQSHIALHGRATSRTEAKARKRARSRARIPAKPGPNGRAAVPAKVRPRSA